MSSFTGVSSIRNVQWKFQKNLQESILLILKTQYIFEFSGLFHCSVIKVLRCRFCVSDKYYIKSLWCCQHFFKFSFLFLYRVNRYYLIKSIRFCQYFFSFSSKKFFWLLLPCKESTFMRIIRQLTNGEGGIWTLAPLLTTYSLSRGAPSASLGTSPNCPTQSLLFFRSVLYYIALFFICQELF